MGSKPVVVLAVPPAIAKEMFAPTDLARLAGAADVRGPFDAKDPRLAGALDGAVAAVTGWRSPQFNEPLLAAAGPGLRLLAHSAGSVKGVVTPAVYDRGIRVTTAAAANAVPVAEFAVAMMAMMLKGVPWLAAEYARGGDYKLREDPWIREFRDLTVGLVGASRVGREVIRLLRAYPRLTVKVYDPYLPDAAAASLGVTKTSLEDVCRCTVVSLHAPSIPETRHMIDARALALLPDGAVLVNTARGSLIDEAALVAEVRRRPLFVALDVTDPEPPPLDSPLRREPRILLTPHIAGAMRQARADMGRSAIDEVLRFLAGQPLHDEVTREMLATQG